MTQWAAVRSHLGAMMEAPQWKRLLAVMATCQGNSLSPLRVPWVMRLEKALLSPESVEYNILYSTIQYIDFESHSGFPFTMLDMDYSTVSFTLSFSAP